MSASFSTVEVRPLSEVESALSEGLDVKSIVTQILALSGHKHRPLKEFHDILEIWTPERAFATYVLAQALKDIEPLAPEVPDKILLSPKRHTLWIEAEKKKRNRRVEFQQLREQELRRETLLLTRRYRQQLRLCYQKFKTKQSYKKQPIRNDAHFKRLRNHFKKHYSMLNVRRELDTFSAAVRWFETERVAVTMWCELACVDLLRCYQGVERRLALVGRCSITIHQIVKELSSRPMVAKPRESRLAEFENRAWTPFEIADKRRAKAIAFIRQLPRDEMEISSPADREFLHRIHEAILGASAISPKQLSRLESIVERHVRKNKNIH